MSEIGREIREWEVEEPSVVPRPAESEPEREKDHEHTPATPKREKETVPA